MSVIKRVLGKMLFSQGTFEFLQRHGIHLMRKHFYSPIPDTGELQARSDLWEEEVELFGVDFNVADQLDLLDNVFPKFLDECEFPLDKTSTQHEYYINNGGFGLVSAAVLHCMIRHFAPRTIVEIGSGNSTYVSSRATMMNQAQGIATKLISVEPYPNQVLKDGFPGLSELIPKKVEQLDTDFFSQLEERDILFIDSSHVVRMGGDVNFLYLELLPRLNEGVIVHIHDVFFPKHYPRRHIIQNRYFFTEQYLLQAFLTYNHRFQVLWCGSYVYLKHLERLTSTFPPPKGLGLDENYFSSSFWMRRIGNLNTQETVT
jgi:hypothetical protein